MLENGPNKRVGRPLDIGAAVRRLVSSNASYRLLDATGAIGGTWLLDPDEILEIVKLPAEIDRSSAKVNLRSGVLEFELLKAREWPNGATGRMSS